ncbi:tRNA modification GTPase MnmE [Planctomycetes bacterium Pan216]|uniref:tRNA modification GTPase MnmE n=1 Tax=Kolteria novifilia TaxID=2527975 RepID=A0A518BCN0_9BACT|nr:tRNA modification GTPase MnmE [Planctomycetes bacterium Pan216]
MALDWNDTIIGPSTAAGPGARAILRLSGPSVPEITSSLVGTSASIPWHRRWVGDVALEIPAWRRSVELTLYSWPEGGSYTGQPSVELHVPASAPLCSAIEARFVEEGVRLARPGEFSLRAFLSGRLDLAQAEGVLGLIEAETVDELREAVDQRTGGLSKPVLKLRNDLLDLLAELEAGLDFVEEDITFVEDDVVERAFFSAREELSRLQSSLQERSADRQLPRLVLIGHPNAGKSSLFNALAESDRAIVNAQAGTTRDYLSTVISLGDTQAELIDTAGIESTGDLLALESAEQREGVARRADVLLHCVPVGEGFDACDEKHTLLVLTKADLSGGEGGGSKGIVVSSKTGQGVETLRSALRERLARVSSEHTSAGTRMAARCGEGLRRAITAIDEASFAQESGLGPEVVAVSLRDVITALGEIVGHVYTNDLLDRIFSKFCIGK